MLGVRLCASPRTFFLFTRGYLFRQVFIIIFYSSFCSRRLSTPPRRLFLKASEPNTFKTLPCFKAQPGVYKKRATIPRTFLGAGKISLELPAAYFLWAILECVSQESLLGHFWISGNLRTDCGSLLFGNKRRSAASPPFL